ncbi:MAG TPA: hypothetical protein PK478_03800 [Nitrospira sp.]|nr:hypothetical protein [Nitrospira sp.]
MADPRNTLTRSQLPAKEAHRFGLGSVAQVESVPNGHWMFGADWLDSCGSNVLVAPNNCDPLLDPQDRVKTWFALQSGVGTDDFTLYGFHRCSAVGDTVSERMDYATDELDLGQWYAVERRFITAVIAESVSPYPAGISGATNALAALLSAWNKPVSPIVHMTINVAIALGSQIQNKGDHLELRTGERVVIGYGYDVGLANATEGTIALTGPVFATVGSTSGLGGETIDRESNTYLALAERPFSIGYLCDSTHVNVNNVITTTA